MISKPVTAHSFYHTCRYICHDREAEILAAEGVRGHDYRLMSQDFISQQQMRPSKERACFHSILSFYPGENPSDATLKEIATRYLERLGITNTQYVVCKHTDKAHLHLHLVANMVNNEGRSIKDSFTGLRGKKIAEQLTREYHLQPARSKNLQLTHLENLNEKEAHKYALYLAISEQLPKSSSLDDLQQRLARQKIELLYKYKGKTSEKQGVSFKIGGFSFKGSQVDRKFSFAGLQKTIEQQQRQSINQQAKGQLRQSSLSAGRDKTFESPTASEKQPEAAQTKHHIPGAFPDQQGGGSTPRELLEEERKHKRPRDQSRGL